MDTNPLGVVRAWTAALPAGGTGQPRVKAAGRPARPRRQGRKECGNSGTEQIE